MKTKRPQDNCDHTIFNENCRSCRNLQNQYYQYLKEVSHFEDIEDVQFRDRPLKSWHSFKFKDIPKTTEDYYVSAQRLLWEDPFSKELHRTIWELHAEGKSNWEISRAIKSIGHTGVDWVINKYRKAMK